jgi:hypothetical protein
MGWEGATVAYKTNGLKSSNFIETEADWEGIAYFCSSAGAAVAFNNTCIFFIISSMVVVF